jgi:hypothetical protein
MKNLMRLDNVVEIGETSRGKYTFPKIPALFTKVPAEEIKHC